MITFDDGLRCHYDIIFPLMIEYNFPAAFFVSTKPLVEKKATNVHESHFVRANVPPERIYEAMMAYLNSHCIKENAYGEDLIRKHYRYDELETARLKYLLNYVLPEDASTKIINDLFAEIVEDEESFCSEWYMTEKEIKALHDRFGCIGSHAHSHGPLASFSDQQSQAEIFESKKHLENVTDAKIEAISYPLGNPKAVSLREGKLAKMSGYAFGFTMERTVNLSPISPQLFARIDCNDLPDVGKKPLFRMINGRLKRCNGKQVGRKVYCVDE